MPRPRFRRLSSTKRQRIMEAAAREFASHGYDNASLNQILQEAAISKGAAYYYFDDKADLFATTVSFYAAELLDVTDLVLSELDADNFWSALATVYERQILTFDDKPWAFGAVKAAWRIPQEAFEAQPALQQLASEIHNRLHAILQRGQELGAIRTDLPLELLAGLFIAVDDASDRWVLANWQDSTREELQKTVRGVFQGLARFMAPPEEDL